MSVLNVRRSGLFDPIMFDSGRNLNNSIGLFANSAGKPTFNPDDPSAWAQEAAKLQSLGDTQGAIQALSMSKSLEDRARAEAARKKARMDALQQQHAQNNLELAGIKGQEKLRAARTAQAQAQKDAFVRAITPRVGEDNANILKTLDYQTAVTLGKEMMKDPKASLKWIKQEDAEGNVRNVAIDENTGRVMADAGIAEPGVEAKEAIKAKGKRKAELSAGSAKRISDIKTATEFMYDFGDGASSGALRKALEWVPGVYTEQGQFDERLNAFAETAARATLKANGETKPTDADVEGMKRAMFGVGRDEQVNIDLLYRFIEGQIADENELREMNGEEPLPIPEKPTIGGKRVGRYVVEEV